jgi:hypothetical protein
MLALTISIFIPISIILTTHKRSPLAPLTKGGTRNLLKVLLGKGSHCGLGVSPSRATGAKWRGFRGIVYV